MPKHHPPIAPRDEIFAFYTAVMRGEIAEYTVRKGADGDEAVPVPPKLADRMKAAEFLERRVTGLSPAADADAAAARDAVTRALEELTDHA